MALEAHFTTSITFTLLMTINYGWAAKPISASTTVSHIPATKISTFEGNGCPVICSCGLSFDHDVLRISDCSEDPKDDLNQVIESHKDIVRLEIVRSYITTLPYNLSNLKQLTHLKLRHNKLGIVSKELFSLTHVKNLDLSFNEIDVIPCELSNLTELTFLGLNGNRIESIMCDLSDMVKLTTLDLSYNALESYPCQLSTLSHLTTLSLSLNEIEAGLCNPLSCNLSNLSQLSSLDLSNNEIQSCGLSNLARLTYVNLSWNRLFTFPCELSSVTQITSLDLSNNRISSVQCNLSNLTNLTSLKLNGNYLDKFPQELSKLNQLSSLDLSENLIMSVHFANLTRLNYLKLSANNLYTFPCKLSTLTQLTSLDLSYNKIISVQCDLSNLTQLTSLNLFNNALSTVPSALFTLLSLTSLGLSGNQLKSMPYELSTLTHLTFLDISYNSFRTVPCVLSTLKLLTNLNLAGNKIMSVQCDLSNLTQLTILNLERNHLSTFPCPLTALTKLVTLLISYNKIASVQCDLSNLTCLTDLNLNHNALPIVPSELFVLTQLNSLALSQNEIESVPCGMSTLTQLRSLYLNSNQIHSVVCDFSRLTKLTVFDLSHNNIDALDSWPISLAYKNPLKNLRLDYNRISHFTNYARAPATLCNEKIKVISLVRNNIKHFMDIVKGWNLKVSHNEELSDCLEFILDQSEGNPLSCDCVDYDVYRQIQVKNVSGYTLRCHYPARLRDKDPLKLSLDQFICDISTNCPAGCKCTKSPYYQNITVKCEQFEETLLPTIIPKLPSEEYQYCIDVRYGNISKLSYRPYLSEIRTLKFSHNVISEVLLDAMLALQNVSILYLDDNRLERLPDNITTAQLTNVIDVRLSQNPWVCDCSTLSTKKWMTEHAKAIADIYSAICNSPSHLSHRNMMYTEDNMFCPNENGNYVIIAAVFGTCIPIICIFSLILVRIRKFIHDKHLAEQMVLFDEIDKEFDVFVSYASEDEDYILDDFIPQLENHNFKVCFHRIHFLGGNTIIDNISECINNSKRTLVYFSNFYKDSRFCMYEFKEALNKDVREGTSDHHQRH